MVDLVKIRKKKAKQKEEAAAAAAEQQTQENAAAPPPEVAPAALPREPEAEPEAPAVTAETPEAAPVIEERRVAAPSDENEDITPAASKLERFKSEAGKRREGDGGAGVAAEEQQEGLLELLTFMIAGENYAVDIERIVEIVTPRAVTRIPNADPTIVGILSLRGTIVTLVDVRRKLRHGSEPVETPDTRIVVIDFRNEIVGFIVDRVLRVVKTEAAGIEPHPVVHATELDAAVRGVFRVGGSLTILLDLDKLLDHNTSAGVTA